MAQVQYYGTGRRKHSVARVRLVPGEGRIVINKRDINDYFGLETLEADRKTTSGFDGNARQLRRYRHRSWRRYFRPSRRNPSRDFPRSAQSRSGIPSGAEKAGFLTRDPRMKERKKYGLKAARRAPQFSKR